MSGPRIVICGPTGSGKTSLAIELALKHNGEIICADSRTIYKYMDIGTAKPTKEQQKMVQHYLLDIVEPNEEFSAAEFKRRAKNAIEAIEKKGNIPFVVGGSGLYIDGLIYDFSFAGKADEKTRTRYQSMNLSQLNEVAVQKQIIVPDETKSNPRHLARLLERNGGNTSKKSLQLNVLYLGIRTNKAELAITIEKRVDNMLESGLIEETRLLRKNYGGNITALLAPGYKAMNDYFDNKISIDDAKKRFVQNDLNLAKRQLTWMRKNHDIIWINNGREAEQQINIFLSKFDTI